MKITGIMSKSKYDHYGRLCVRYFLYIYPYISPYYSFNTGLYALFTMVAQHSLSDIDVVVVVVSTPSRA